MSERTSQSHSGHHLISRQHKEVCIWGNLTSSYIMQTHALCTTIQAWLRNTLLTSRGFSLKLVQFNNRSTYQPAANNGDILHSITHREELITNLKAIKWSDYRWIDESPPQTTAHLRDILSWKGAYFLRNRPNSLMDLWMNFNCIRSNGHLRSWDR